MKQALGVRVKLWMNTILIVLALSILAPERRVEVPQDPVAAPVVVPRHPDPVIARILDHLDVRPIIIVVDRQTVGDDVWKRVKSLNAFRVHNPNGTTNAPIYLVKTSDLYRQAAQLPGANSDVWCKYAAIIMHELQHNAPMTEKAALEAEAAQVQKCLNDGHFQSHGNAYLMELFRKHRVTDEHTAHQ